MKIKIILVMALLAGAVTSRAQTPNTLQFSFFTGYGYPQIRPNGTLMDYTNNKSIVIGSSTISDFDYQYHYDPMGDFPTVEETSDGVFARTIPFATSYTAKVLLETNATGCTVCDLRIGGETNSAYDEYHENFDFSGDPLGTYVTKTTIGFTATYLIKLPVPGFSLVSTTGNFCSGASISFKSLISWPRLDGVRYSYEFQAPGGSWTVFDEVTTPQFTFSVNNYPALMNAINTQTSNFNIQFRMRALAANDTSGYTPIQTIQFSPPPPTVGGWDSDDACPSVANGAVTLKNITGSGHYAYVLRLGKDNTDGCDPNTPGSCTAVAASDTFSVNTGGNYTIPGIPAGEYTLLIANGGGTSGACYQHYDVTIQSITALTLSSIAHTDVSCAGAANGSITVNTSGGRAVHYVLKRQPAGAIVATRDNGVFTALPGGTYLVSVTDTCGATLSPTFLINEPTRVTGTCIKTDATCNNPGNGNITVNVSNGSGTYNYYLYLNNAVVSSQLNMHDTRWNAGNLVAGTYRVLVLDSAHTSCDGYADTLEIAGPAALGVHVSQQQGLNCYGIATGSLQLQATGGSGAYVYTIDNTDSLLNYTNSAGTFANLYAGHYTAKVQSAVSGCTDQFSYAAVIEITQPAAIAIGLNKTDVRCYEERNGSVAATLSGGTGVLNVAWQQQDAGGAWQAASGTITRAGNASTLSNLAPGAYRLLVTDANSCKKISGEMAVTQPLLLDIGSVQTKDIVCYGTSGTITPVATGGNGGNVFAYSSDGGTNYKAFTPGASFGAGTYLIKVTDSKSCTAAYPTPQVITAPVAALHFTDLLSDYNGINISCYGAGDGSVTVSATGGNGGSYTGYTYAVDGGAYQSSPVLGSLTAGAHTIRVQDGRGCMVSQTETLVQPATTMAQNLLNKKDNDCVGGQAGLLSVSVSGGTTPYQFSIDGGVNFQNSGDFNNLASGTYSILAKDVNGCSLGKDYTLVSLYAPVTITPAVRAVQCNGGNDGNINLQVNGGVMPYNYQWNVLPGGPIAASGATAASLTAGIYQAQITDSKGCQVYDTLQVNEPQLLTATFSTRPFCSDAAGGRVQVTASGGAPPYQYSANGGASYQSDPNLSNLAAGAHTISVTDSHGCSWSQPVTIVSNPLVPVVNFLVSTQQHARDTLQVEDISVPKPDSLHWVFDPQTVLLGSSAVGPLIRYPNAGSYPLSMTAWYSGCDFTIGKVVTIQPYDPNSTSAPVLAGLSFDTVQIGPNPNTGVFSLRVKLFRAQRLVMNIMSVTGQPVLTKKWDAQQLVSEQVTLPVTALSGVYILQLIAEKEVREYNIIVNK
jgi:hypothetical protein